ncbi:MAG: hypothetical protein ACPLZY_01040 [Candidatus Norongarragalinales archaeon]
MKRDLQAKVEALRRKAKEFREKGDLSRAEHYHFLAEHLQDFYRKNKLGFN